MKDLAKTYIIAEIGVNHNGSFDIAKQMIDAAKLSGADAVKFQTFTAETLVSISTPKVDYQIVTTDKDESHYDMIKSLELSKEVHFEIIKYCKQIQIEFISTPYDIQSAKFLDELGVKIFKTASADIVDLPLQKFLADTKKPVLVSTGMATLDEVNDVVEIYKAANNSDITLLHCVSNYPCEYTSLNLNAMLTLGDEFNLAVGYSDHAKGVYPAVAAVALGAKVVEKHFTLNRAIKGPDHKASSTPDEFKDLVTAIRVCEMSLGDHEKKVQLEEMQMRQVSRKSIFVKNKIGKNTKISLKDLILKRPGTGLYSKSLLDLDGKFAKYNLEDGHMISMDDVE